MERYAEATTVLQTALELTPDLPLVLAHLAFAHARAGQTEKAALVVGQLKELQARHFVSAYFFALYYSGVSDTEQTLTWLQHAFEERAPWLLFIAQDFVFDELRGLPVFDDLIFRIGVPQSLAGKAES